MCPLPPPPALHPDRRPSPVLTPTRLQVSGTGANFPVDFEFPAETLQLRKHYNWHPNSSLKISYTFDLVEFAEWLVRKKNVKQKKRRKNKATLSASFDLKTASLLHSGLKGEEKKQQSGRKCLLFKNVI